MDEDLRLTPVEWVILGFFSLVITVGVAVACVVLMFGANRAWLFGFIPAAIAAGWLTYYCWRRAFGRLE